MRLSFTCVGIMTLGLMGCALAHAPDGGSQKGKAPVDGNSSDAAAAPTLKIAGVRSGIQKERFAVVRDEKALDALLKDHNPYADFDRKALDFKKHTVVGYFAGSKPTGGFTVEIIGVDRKKEGATVKVRLWKPGKGMFVTEALTSPFVIQAVEKLPARVTHKVTEQERTAP
jgi:hypothetical protein